MWLVTSLPSVPLKELTSNIFKNSSPIFISGFVIIAIARIGMIVEIRQYGLLKILSKSQFDVLMWNGRYIVSHKTLVEIRDVILLICDQNRIFEDHIQGDGTSSSTAPPPTDEWLTIDSIVKSWIFLTFVETLQESIVTLLNDFGLLMSDDDIVTYALHGLSDKFAHVAGIIAHRVPFPDLDEMRSMVTTEEMRLNAKYQTSTLNTTWSAPTVLMVETSSRGQDVRGSRDSRTNS
ncbi:hypothetical protein Tco_0347793 [Tanacetum coccineum]